MLKKRFLVPGVFAHNAYVRDTDRISRVRKKQDSTINAFAVGVDIYNDFFFEITSAALRGEDPAASASTLKALAE